MRGWWQDLTDLVLPAECGGCGKPRTVLCPKCRASLSGAAPRRVRPVPEPHGLPVVHAAAPYEDEVRAALLAHKERGALALAAPLGATLAGAVRAGLRERGGIAERVLLVPVPSARAAVRARGQDPTRRIALAAARELRRTGTLARVLGVLRQRGAVADQAGLTSRQRLENLAGALEVASGGGRLLAGGRIVLVDDLMTTGASLTEAARAVRVALPEMIVYGDVAWEERAQRITRVTAATGAESARPTTEKADRTRPVTGKADRTQPVTGNADRTRPVTAKVGMNGAGYMIRAAVVAASPESFEMNWN